MTNFNDEELRILLISATHMEAVLNIFEAHIKYGSDLKIIETNLRLVHIKMLQEISSIIPNKEQDKITATLNSFFDKIAHDRVNLQLQCELQSILNKHGRKD